MTGFYRGGNRADNRMKTNIEKKKATDSHVEENPGVSGFSKPYVEPVKLFL